MSEQNVTDGDRPIRGKAARLEYILRVAHASGFAHVDDLADALGVSRMTIHRDLDDLHQKGLVRKVRGGASITSSTQFEADWDYRMRARLKEKQAIANAAIHLIEEGDVVLLDDSTTALQLVPLLNRFEAITVITNSEIVVEEVRKSEGINLICLGGQYNRRSASYLGVLSEDTVSRLAADVTFLSSSSLHGTTLYHQDQLQLAIKKAILKAASRRVLLIDHSKVGQRALFQLCDVSDFTHVVMDSGVSDTQQQLIGEQGVEVIVAPMDGPSPA